MKVLVLGASGIVGQHMRLCVPPSVRPVWHRKETDLLHVGCDLTDKAALVAFLDNHKPDCIVNLAGENNVDAVERNPQKAAVVNGAAVAGISEWCQRNSARLIQVSTQAVFGGEVPPYGPTSPTRPCNAYGIQRAQAEQIALEAGGTVVRLTFVLGVRPMPLLGRQNPVEAILSGQRPQVSDRWFSPLFASDAARGIWAVVVYGADRQGIIHMGLPRKISRYDIAKAMGMPADPVSHDSFTALAPRPVDTTYAAGTTGYWTAWDEGIAHCKTAWEDGKTMNLADRAREIAIFLGRNEDECMARLGRGFGAAHADVTTDFRTTAPADDEALLEWYRNTEAYIWELSAYHCDPGFNYAGMCKGVVDRLKAEGVKTALVLGDGIGDMTLSLRQAVINATYHDLDRSRTAAYARFRLWRFTWKIAPVCMSTGWAPEIEGQYDAIVAADFLEHCTDVPAWVRSIHAALKPGGWFFAQNGFACGSGEHGSMPMHLARNDRFEKDWDPLLVEVGFTQDSSNWYRK